MMDGWMDGQGDWTYNSIRCLPGWQHRPETFCMTDTYIECASICHGNQLRKDYYSLVGVERDTDLYGASTY
jgi:hypothetical protein